MTKAARSAPKAGGETNPYLNARREWNERYGDYIKQARHWRNAAFVSFGVAFMAVAGLAYVAAQRKVVPYLVEVNHTGDTVTARVATKGDVGENMVRAIVAGWVEDWRTVSVDAGVQNRLVKRVYAHLSQTDAAYTSVNAHYQANNPFERAQREVVSAQIKNVLRISKDSLQVEWEEQVRDRRGNLVKKENYKASITIGVSVPSSEEEIMSNASGIYMKDVTWTKQLM